MEALYDKGSADALTQSEQGETWREETDRLKVELLLEYAGDAKSLLDIGCAWGQILLQLVDKIPTLAGVDESADRLEQLRNNNKGITTYQCRSTALEPADSSFDAVLTSHIMHELALFGSEDDLTQTLSEIRRGLTDAGRYVTIDHRDPGEGTVSIRPNKQTENLKYFADKFVYRPIKIEWDGDVATMSMRDCHDFVTKIWSLRTGAEDLEMNETHTVMDPEVFGKTLDSAGFKTTVIRPFNPITRMMDHYGIDLVKGDDWGRQFIMVAEKA